MYDEKIDYKRMLIVMHIHFFKKKIHFKIKEEKV